MLLVVLAIIALILKQCNNTNSGAVKESNPAQMEQPGKRGLNRNPAVINYSRHARCRMNCRHISEAEVKDVLQKGKVNYTKSDLKGEECKKRYAVEGNTKDNQKVRIIFAPCNDEVTVVTVIDLGKEWACDCE